MGFQYVSDEEYFAHPAISSSKLKDFLKSPKLFEAKYITKTLEEKKTDAMRFGSLFHMAVLEPNKFRENLIMHEPFDFRKKVHKDFHVSLTADLKPGQFLIDTEELSLIQKLKRRVDFHKGADKLLSSSSYKECASFLEDEYLKAKFDLVGDDFIADLKTTRSNSIHDFSYECIRFGYYMQLAFYQYVATRTDGIPRKCYIIGVPTSGLDEVFVCPIPGIVLEKEFQTISNGLTKLLEALRTNTFQHAYPDEVELFIPSNYFDRDMPPIEGDL